MKYNTLYLRLYKQRRVAKLHWVHLNYQCLGSSRPAYMYVSEYTAHCIAFTYTSMICTSNFNIYPVHLQQVKFELLYNGCIYISNQHVSFFQYN